MRTRYSNLHRSRTMSYGEMCNDKNTEDFRARQARACLPEEKHWKHICCVCGEATHNIADECGECISPQAAAHADALVRTAFQVDVDETITSENNMELCLKVTRHTLKVLERLRATQRHECGAETTTMMHTYTLGWCGARSESGDAGAVT